MLGCAHKGAGLPAHGIHERAVITARLRCKDQQHLLRALGHLDLQPRLAARRFPRVAAKEPSLGRRIRRSAQEGGHHQVMRRFSIRHPGDDLQSIAGGQDRDFSDGQCARAALHLNTDRRTHQIKGGLLHGGLCAVDEAKTNEYAP